MFFEISEGRGGVDVGSRQIETHKSLRNMGKNLREVFLRQYT